MGKGSYEGREEGWGRNIGGTEGEGEGDLERPPINYGTEGSSDVYSGEHYGGSIFSLVTIGDNSL